MKKKSPQPGRSREQIPSAWWPGKSEAPRHSAGSSRAAVQPRSLTSCTHARSAHPPLTRHLPHHLRGDRRRTKPRLCRLKRQIAPPMLGKRHRTRTLESVHAVLGVWGEGASSPHPSTIRRFTSSVLVSPPLLFFSASPSPRLLFRSNLPPWSLIRTAFSSCRRSWSVVPAPRSQPLA